MVMDSAAIGAVFLVCLLVSALMGEPKGLELVDPQLLAVLGAAGAFGVGATVTLIGSSIWSIFFPYESDEKRFGPLRRGPRGTRRMWSEQLAPDQHRITAHALPEQEVARRAMLATSLVIYTEANSEFIQFLRRRHQGFASGLNIAAAIALGNASAFLLTPLISYPRLLWLGIWIVLGIVIVRSGFRQRHEAEDMERLWFEARLRAKQEA